MKYPNPKAGDWIQPVAKGYKMMCCDCGLVHKMDFRHVIKVTKDRVLPTRGGKVQFRVWRDERATAAARRARKKKDALSNVRDHLPRKAGTPGANERSAE